MIERQRIISGVLGLLFLAVVSFSLWQVQAQTMPNTRIGMNRLVRGLASEPTGTYLADTTLDRFISYAHRVTKATMGAVTDVDLDTIVTSSNLARYPLADATAGQGVAERGKVTAVFLRDAEAIGHGERMLQYAPVEAMGVTGDQAPGSFYTIMGDVLALSQSPNGGDTLFVYYSNVSADLDADATALEVAEEDELAVAMLTLAWVKIRDQQLQTAQLAFQWWQQAIAMKGVKPPTTEEPVR